MSELPIEYVAFALAVVAWFVSAMALLLPWLRKEKQGYPLEDQLETLLLPHLYEACLGAFKASETIVDEMKVRLDGVDKKKIAELSYDMLPDTIGVLPIGIIKMLISREKWGELVQDAYDHFTASYQANRQKYEEALDQWKQEYSATPEEPRKPDPK